MKERSVEDIREDMQRMDYGDPKIAAALDALYRLHYKQNRPYYELWKSTLTDTVKYLLTAYPDGSLKVLDLDTNLVYAL